MNVYKNTVYYFICVGITVSAFV